MEKYQKLLEEAQRIQGKFWLSGGEYDAGRVGAAVLTDRGHIYSGICMDMACGVGFCAEHAAVIEMLKNRETRILAVVAVDDQGVIPPCGRCRELMMQVDAHNREADVLLPRGRVAKLRELLPDYWHETDV